MKQVAWKLAGSILLLVACVPLLRFSGWFGAGVVVGLVLAPLYWFDLGRALRSTPDGCVGLRLLGLVMGVPQALFGVLAALIGLSIIGWVLYNSFWVPSSHYSGGFLTLGIGPVLVLVGSSLVVDAFRKSRAHDARIDT
jgi:hypothetical protein